MHRTSWPALLAATGLVLSAAALTAAPAGAAENGDLIVFTRGGDLWLVSPGGGAMSNITNTTDLVEDSPSWTPNGDGIRFVRSSAKGANGDVVERNLESGEETTLATGVDDVDWAPGGNQVTYTRDLATNPRKNQTQQDVFVSDASFGNERNVSNHPSHDANPDFSGDGRIAFDSAREGSSSSVWVADLAAGTLSRVPTSDPQDGGKFPAWSPDNTQLVYMEYVEPTVNWGLRIYDYDGNVERRLTTGGGNEWDAEFSPDGTQVVFAHWSGSPKEKFHIRRVVVDGGAESVVTQADGLVSRQPSWQPKPATTSGTTGSSPSPTPTPCVLPPPLSCP